MTQDHGSSKSSSSGSQTAFGSPKQEVQSAKNALSKAIEIHHKHEKGGADSAFDHPSQKQMMGLMQRAFASLEVIGKAL